MLAYMYNNFVIYGEAMEIIKFYHEYEEFGWLSNYFLCDVVVDGKQWKSTEHYYQAQKVLDEPTQEVIRMAGTPDDAKKIGNSETLQIREDWKSHRIVAMRKALEAKFLQHGDLLTQLLNTGDSILVENSLSDYFWGNGADGSGRNMLGLMLSHLRTELRTGL